MANTYTDIPDNFSEIEAFVETDIMAVKNIFYSAKRIAFYDACSFQKHSRYADRERSILIGFYKEQGITIFITRCILMELASDRHILADEYVCFLKALSDAGVRIVIYNEEYTYDILSECFATNDTVNQYLIWAARTVSSPVSTIAETLKADKKLAEDVIEGRNLKQSDLYYRFFTNVRKNKEHGDNLGEELIAVCVCILSCLPGTADGKMCIITDDKGAAGKIDSALRKTHLKSHGAKIILFSTPKLVQYMFREQVDIVEEEMVRLISQGTSGNIVVMGVTAYDLKVNDKISMTGRELVQRIMEPNGIDIVF